MSSAAVERPVSPSVERPASPVSPRSQELLKKLSNKDLYIAQLQAYLNRTSTKYSAIFDAIGMDDYDLVHECLERKSELDAINEEGYSPLTYAAHFSNHPFVRMLLGKCMSVDGRDA
jgi:ankyrin repeat protein